MITLLPLGLLAAAWLALAITRRRRPQPRLLLPAFLLECGCLLLPSETVPCAVHDPAEPPVERWAAEISEEDR